MKHTPFRKEKFLDHTAHCIAYW